MKLANVILDNERTGKVGHSQKLVRAKLKELVNQYPEQITDLLTSLDIKASIVAPKSVLYSILVKHLSLHSELRAAIARIILGKEESLEYLNANGQGMSIAGGALQAIGSVLTGLGRNQTMNSGMPMDEATRLRLEKERERKREEEEKKRKTNMTIGITVGAVVLIAVVLLVLHSMKQKEIQVGSKGTASVQTLNS